MVLLLALAFLSGTMGRAGRAWKPHLKRITEF